MSDNDLLTLMGMGPPGEYRVVLDEGIDAIMLEIRYQDGKVIRAAMTGEEADALAQALIKSVRKLERRGSE